MYRGRRPYLVALLPIRPVKLGPNRKEFGQLDGHTSPLVHGNELPHQAHLRALSPNSRGRQGTYTEKPLS